MPTGHGPPPEGSARRGCVHSWPGIATASTNPVERPSMSGERKSWAQSDTATRLLTGLVLVLGGAALAGVLWWTTASSRRPLDLPESTTPAVVRTDPGESARYVGVASCRECHPGECALFARSGHARTLRPAATD